MNYDQLCLVWARSILSAGGVPAINALIGGQEWNSRRWDSDTLVFYNRTAFREWLACQPAEWHDLVPRSMRPE